MLKEVFLGKFFMLKFVLFLETSFKNFCVSSLWIKIAKIKIATNKKVSLKENAKKASQR